MGSPQQFILGSDMKWTPCLLFVASGSITQDLTHIQNEDFPSAEAALRVTAPPPQATDRAVNIMGGANICAIKVEFITVQLNNPSDVGVCCEERISVTTPARNPGAGFGVENLCGVLTGQHIFVDVAPAVGAMAMTLNIDPSNLSGDRMWKILIRQI